MTTKQDDTDQTSDAKRSFAWGQLFAGSLIGGLAVWKLGHKLTNTEPSEWFTGLSVAYEEVRDFLFSWVHMNLSADEKSVLVMCVVVYGAVLRAVGYFPHWRALLIIGTWFVFVAGSFALLIASDNSVLPRVLEPIASALLPIFSLGIGGVRGPVIFLANVAVWSALLGGAMATVDRLTARPHAEVRRLEAIQRLTIYNILFTVGSGIILLLLNWATS